MIATHSNPLLKRLQNLESRLATICRITGIPGCSIGVVHDGMVAWRTNLGLRDVAAGTQPQSNTLFNLDSLTKGITAAAFGCLVNEGLVKWTTPTRDVLPDFEPSADELDKSITPLDLLSMRSGHAALNSLSWQGHNIVLVDKKDTMHLWNATPRLGSFRSSFTYNNWGYAVIGLMMERLTKQPVHEILMNKIIKPLGLKRTVMTGNESPEDVAVSYGILDDRSPVEIPRPSIGVGKFTEGASGLLSTIDDMLVLYSAFSDAVNDQFRNKSTTTPGNPFMEVTTLVQALTSLDNDINLREQSYACGWIRCQLPGPDRSIVRSCDIYPMKTLRCSLEALLAATLHWSQS